MIWYSKTTNGFYDDRLKYSQMPTDAVQITEEVHTALLAAQEITADANGNPISVNRPGASNAG